MKWCFHFLFLMLLRISQVLSEKSKLRSSRHHSSFCKLLFAMEGPSKHHSLAQKGHVIKNKNHTSQKKMDMLPFSSSSSSSSLESPEPDSSPEPPSSELPSSRISAQTFDNLHNAFPCRAGKNLSSNKQEQALSEPTFKMGRKKSTTFNLLLLSHFPMILIRGHGHQNRQEHNWLQYWPLISLKHHQW